MHDTANTATGPAATVSPDDDPSMTGARWFVSLVFAALGLSFLAETAAYFSEFRALDWWPLLLLHGHLFLFFSTFGLVALVAFHLPATVFTHMYWTHIRHGRLRFAVGAVVIAAIAVANSLHLDSARPAELWQLAPSVLAADQPKSVACDPARQSCRRLRLLDGIGDLRDVATHFFALSKLARSCAGTEYVETPPDQLAQRRCLPAGEMLSARACCKVQESYGLRLASLYAVPANHSKLDGIAHWAQIGESFFVLVVLTIGVLLVAWRRLLEERYQPSAPAIERALLIGAAAMLPWPFMDYAFAAGMQTLWGRESDALQLRLSLVIAPWALLLMIFFLARMGRKIERLGQLAGAGASTVAVLRYEQLDDVGVHVFGIGAPWWMAVVIAVFIVGCLTMLRWPRHLQRAINGVVGRHPDIGTGPPPGFKRRDRAQKT